MNKLENNNMKTVSKIENILKLPFNMNIIKVIPDKYEFLYSKFKNLGFDSKQTYIPNK